MAGPPLAGKVRVDCGSYAPQNSVIPDGALAERVDPGPSSPDLAAAIRRRFRRSVFWTVERGAEVRAAGSRISGRFATCVRDDGSFGGKRRVVGEFVANSSQSWTPPPSRTTSIGNDFGSTAGRPGFTEAIRAQSGRDASWRP